MKRFTQVIGLIGLAMLCIVGPVGCGKTTLAPAGVYQGDKVLYNAEKTITTSYRLFDSFLKWELQYRSILPVEVSRAADTIRLNAKKWITSAGNIRDAYAANPTAENRDKLKLALDLIDTALSEATVYMANNQANAPNKGLTAGDPLPEKK